MLSDSIGYRSTNDAVAFFSILFLVIYALTNTKLSDYKWIKPHQAKSKLDETKEENMQVLISSDINEENS